MTEERYQRAMASIYLAPEDAAWLVTQSPTEIAELIRAVSPDELIELTLGNYSSWNGKPLFVRAGSISAVAPPKDQEVVQDADQF